MKRLLHQFTIIVLVWVACCSLATGKMAVSASECPPVLAPPSPCWPLDDAALTHRIKEYSGTEKGQERAHKDRRARADGVGDCRPPGQVWVSRDGDLV